MLRTILMATILLVMGAVTTHGQDPVAAEFFESRIRPILIERCHECHGATKQEAGLRLDSATEFHAGGDSGKIFHPDLPEESSLLKVIRYQEDIRMPPDGKLSAVEIESISEWLKNGAFWPSEPGAAAEHVKESISEQARKHWAFQPLHMPPQPAGAEETSSAHPVDAFIIAALRKAEISPGEEADRRTLIRRATFDLHGLPPTPEEVQQFEQDPSPDAWRQLIDRLLASPRYGERWGRHWLDVARYSDTKGYVRLKDNPLYPAAWTYRDYVIRAFNEDLPYDRFIVEQLAADQLESGGENNQDPRSLSAMGYLTLGQRFINSQNDIIDDRIDVVTRGLLGLTVTCARCHDHKFDPVPTADYYSLYGVFASSVEPDVPPVILTNEKRAEYAGYFAELEKRTRQFHDFLSAQQAKLETSFRQRAGEYLLAGQFEKVQANFLPVMFLIDSTKDLNPAVVQRWARLLEKTRQTPHPVLAPWHRLTHLATTVSESEFAVQSAHVLTELGAASTAETVNESVLNALTATPMHNLQEVAVRYGVLFEDVTNRWQSAHAAGGVKKLDDPALEQVRQLLYGADSPCTVMLMDVPDFLFVDATTQNQFHEQQRQIEDWIASAGAAPHAHILRDAETPVEPRIFLRGNASNPGLTVPRQFLKVLSPADRRPFQNGSGRLELAQAISDPRNPLTARVLVNRVWMHHFGTGLVRTPSDFGLRGELPTHPELLDYLALEFMTNGWSIKSLHRLIMQSSAYQQVNSSQPEGEARDPENRLLWRMHRRRLDWESMRDSLLSVSGELDETMGGPSIPLFSPPFATRRSVYGFVDRQNLPGLLRTFDFAAPDSSTPQRSQTSVPQQALYLMNSPFLKGRAIALAERIERRHPGNGQPQNEILQQRIFDLYWMTLSRSPDSEELKISLEYLTQSDQVPAAAAEPGSLMTPWQEYAQALLLSNEFLFVD